MKALVRSHVNPLDAAWSVLKSLPDDRLREFAESIGQDRPAETGTLYGAPLSETIAPRAAGVIDNIDEEGREAKMREQAEDITWRDWPPSPQHRERGKWKQARDWLETAQRYKEGAPLRSRRGEAFQPRTYHGSVAKPGRRQKSDFIAENAPGP